MRTLRSTYAYINSSYVYTVTVHMLGAVFARAHIKDVCICSLSSLCILAPYMLIPAYDYMFLKHSEHHLSPSVFSPLQVYSDLNIMDESSEDHALHHDKFMLTLPSPVH